MDLKSRVFQILNDPRFADDDANEQELISEYGSDHAPEAIYLLANEFGWRQIYELLTQFLRDDNRSECWETSQIVLFYAASDHKHKTRHCPIPPNATIALLYHRFPDGIDEGDRIWSIVRSFKGVEHWSDYDPMKDADIVRELEALRRP